MIANRMVETRMVEARMIKKCQQGVTLIEVMIVVVILGVLVSIAYPSYHSTIQKTYRRDAQAHLMSLASDLERFYTLNDTYENFATTAQLQPDDPDLALRYLIRFRAGSEPSVSGYTLEAVPRAASPQADDDCQTLHLDQVGNKTAGTTPAANEKGDECW